MHTTPELRSQWASVAERSLDFDGAGSMIFSSFDSFLAAFADPYYINVIAVDECRFSDKSKTVTATSTMGTPKKIVDDGEIKIKLKEGVIEEFKKWEEKGN